MQVNVELWHLLLAAVPVAGAIIACVFYLGRTLGRGETKTDALYRAVTANTESIARVMESKADVAAVAELRTDQTRLWE